MAVSTYTTKRGDTLWSICVTYASSISGSTTSAKIATLVEINDIKDQNEIPVGMVLKFSASASGTASASTSTSSSSQATVSNFGLKSDDTSGRTVIANWKWSKSNTAGYTCRWQQYLNGKWVGSDTDVPHPEDMYCQSKFSADKSATKVRFQVRPYYKDNNAITYWSSVGWSKAKEYDFSNNPPLPPGTPSVKLDELNDRILVMAVDPIVASDLDAKYVQFNIVKNNTVSFDTTANVAINTNTNYVSHRCTVDYGADYKVRARSVSAKGKTSGWSGFSSPAGTKPVAPAKITANYAIKRSDGSIAIHLEWAAVTNATSYIVEYTTLKDNFDTGTDSWDEKSTNGAHTSIDITGIDIGLTYYLRVRSKNGNGESDPTSYVTVVIGRVPGAPTTWSSANSVFVGEPLDLNWTHNTTDGSAQTYAMLKLKINDEWLPSPFTFENTTNSTTGELVATDEFTYGRAISYKGELHVELNTQHPDLKDSTIAWKVRTAGVTKEWGGEETWSTERTIHIYDKPNLSLGVSSDLAGNMIVEELTALPFYVKAQVDLESYSAQKPIGYHLRVAANNFYETVDDTGSTKTISPGDAVYSKYFVTDQPLVVEMSAVNIDLESGMTYTVECVADMSTGLSISKNYDFTVSWTDVTYTLDAVINVDEESYTASIVPICEDADGNLVENVVLSVYRREYTGGLTEIATDIPNNGTAVTDPHPALDYARYRLIAKDVETGAISFYDMPGYRIGCTSVIIQWDEEHTVFEVSDEFEVEGPSWSGSMLVLPYNVKVSDQRSREVSRVNYAGREYAVSYHGTAISEAPSWSTTIPKDDIETIYALRRLSLWTGSAYIREPSGMGFWADIEPSFNLDYDAVTVPVTLKITRVEGGV